MFSALPPDLRDAIGLASSRFQTGRLLYMTGRATEGEASTRTWVGCCRTLVAERPGDLEVRFRLALAEVNLGNFGRDDRPEMATAQYRRALEQWEILCRPENARPRYLESYGRTLSDLGLLTWWKKVTPPAGADLDGRGRAGQALAGADPCGQGRPGQSRHLPEQPGLCPGRRGHPQRRLPS